jgi:hypothetical protein
MFARTVFPLLTFGVISVSSFSAIAAPLPPTPVPGTAASLIPPQGFQPSQQFAGFEQPQSGASIMVTELPIPASESPQVLEQLSSKAVLSTKGMQLIEAKDTDIGGFPGRLLLVSQGAQGVSFLKWIAVAARGDRLLTVVAAFPEQDAATLREPLRQAVTTLTWQPNAEVDLLSGLPFRFQPQGDLKAVSRMANTIVLTREGAQPPLAPSQPMLVMGSAYSDIKINDIAEFSRTRLQQTAEVRNLKETGGHPHQVAGYPAFELTAQGYDRATNIPLTVYQVIVTTAQTYYIVQGLIASDQAATYLPLFRAIANSLKPL